VGWGAPFFFFFVAQIAVGHSGQSISIVQALDAGLFPFRRAPFTAPFMPCGLAQRCTLRISTTPSLASVPPGAGVDRNHSTFLVVDCRRANASSPAHPARPEGLQAAIGFGQQSSSGSSRSSRVARAVIHRRSPLLQLLQCAFTSSSWRILALGLLLVVQEVGLGRRALLQVLLACVQCRYVKDSPGHGPRRSGEPERSRL